jgi:PAS domain S-box-containing protein
MNKRNFKVFVVDNDPNFGRIIYNTIHNSGEDCDVMLFESSKDFFTAFNENKVQIAIIDDDLTEADVDGLYILKDIVARGGDVKVIALSGDSSVNKILEYMDEGAWKYISKADEHWPRKIENYVKEAILDYKRSRMIDSVSYEQAIDIVLRKDEMLTAFFNNFPALFGILSGEGKFLMANDEWEQKLGWSARDLKHFTVMDLMCSDCKFKFQQCFEDEQDGETQFNCEVKRKDGTLVSINWQMIKKNEKYFCIGRFQ